MSFGDASTVRLGDLFNPIAGVLPSGVVSADVIANSALTFSNGTANYAWNDNPLKFNIQGQKWFRDRRVVIPQGVQYYDAIMNVGTPRMYSVLLYGFFNLSNQYLHHITELEFVFTGTKLSIEFYNMGGNNVSDGNNDGVPDYGGDMQVYLEHGGKMWKLGANPLTATKTDGTATFRNITFANPYHGRIRIHMGGCAFSKIRTDSSSIIAPSPPRPFAIADGDSYFESSQALAADTTTGWFSSGIIDFLFEKTGFVFARRGQGATGFFSNGAGIIYDDTEASAQTTVGPFSVTLQGLSRTLSTSRKNWMTQSVSVLAGMGRTFANHAGEDFSQPLGRRPLFYLLNGTWNDASVGGVTQQQMYDRSKECYQWIRTTDPYCTFIHVGPEPFDDTLFGNAIGPPRHGDKSDIHRVAQMQAASEVSMTEYINPFGPDEPWWTGAGPINKGTQGDPTDSQQAQLVSRNDGIHATKHGNEFYAAKIVEQMADIRIPRSRAEGFV